MTKIILFTLISIQALAKPFWTEKTTYQEGDRVYFVGVSTNNSSLEEGRKKALNNAKSEISNFLQISNLNNFTFHTQMNYEEETESGYTVYRLMWADREELLNIQKENQEKDLILKEKEIQSYKEYAREKEIKNNELEKIKSTIQHNSQKIPQMAICGMTAAEALKIIGTPRSKTKCYGKVSYNYGRYWLKFENNLLVCVQTLSNFNACGDCMFSSAYQCN
tara:strand:- start:3202 stop:3864 length:663 start_codon:yes stop_codon:yes gene_type:complete